MTISNENRETVPAVGTGSNDEFSFEFKVFADSEVVVVETDTDGVEDTLTLTTDYTVALNENQDVSPGGTVTLTSPLTLDHLLTITSAIPNTQGVKLTNLGGFFPAVINNALDRLTALVQQLRGPLNRALRIPISDGTSLNVELPTAALRANSVLSFDADGNATTVALADVGGGLDGVFSGLANNDFMAYNGSNWVNKTPAAARTALGLVIGTNVQAYDAGLASIAGLTTAADKMIYTTALDTYAVATLTAAGRALLDDADAAAQRATLSVYSAAETDAAIAAGAATPRVGAISTPSTPVIGTATQWTGGDGWITIQIRATSSSSTATKYEVAVGTTSTPTDILDSGYVFGHINANWEVGEPVQLSFPIRNNDYFKITKTAVTGSAASETVASIKFRAIGTT